MFLSEIVILKAYEGMAKLTDGLGKKPLEVTSALRYLLAASRLMHENQSTEIDLSVNSPLRDKFINAVGNIVKIHDTIYYTNNFLHEFKSGEGYSVGNNFLTTVLKRNGTYPGRPAPLFKITDEKIIFLSGIADILDKKYHKFSEVKIYLVLWLLRNENGLKKENLKTEQDFIDSLNSIISANYEQTISAILNISKKELNSFLTANSLVLNGFLLSETRAIYGNKLLQSQKETVKKKEIIVTKLNSNITRQKILFGAPGTGKSHKINQLRKKFETKEFKTVFHPDSDYTSFVGAYKPMMKGDDVRYAFVPQVFTKAYTYAWNNPDELVLLTIEEINRGNCAQIFGDLFQCLDRNPSGASEYAIDAEYDLAEYLKENLENQEVMESFFEENYQAEDCFSKIALPQNLLIYATMNTSDQSLFPMDSAFKRRWDWEYVPINYEKANEMTIQLDETTTYNWGDFIKRINEKIYDITQSEDKQLGNYFVKTNDNQLISLDVFRSKVMFYLWSEIFKEENEADTIFKYGENGEHKTFTFNQLYNENAAEILKSFMAYNEISPT
jgi:hypothetical protein